MKHNGIIDPEKVEGKERLPLVSVIMPCYNCLLTLEESVRSVMKQSFRDWELLLVDDGSTDGSRTRIRLLAAREPRIRPVLLMKNSGVAEARNVGMQAARGRFMAFLDADDVWEPEKLKEQLEWVEATGAAFSWTAYGRMDSQGNRLSRVRKAPESLTFRQLLKGNVIGCSTVIVDTAKTGPITMEPVRQEDYYLWLKLLRKGVPGTGLNRVLTWYRVSSGSLSGNKFRSAHWNWVLYRRHLGLGLPASFWYFINYALRGIWKSI